MDEKKAKKSAMKQLPAWLVLCIVALVAGLMLGMTNGLTEEKIEEQALLAADAARRNVLPAAQEFELMELKEGAAVQDCYAAKANGQLAGYTAQITVKGYGGEIEIITGMDIDGAITGISVGGANFAETAGLGARAKEPWFMEQFRGITPPAVKSENVDGISGASITTGAVLSGVNKCADYIKALIFGDAEGTDGGIVNAVEATAPEGADAFWTGDNGCIVQVTEQGFGGAIEIKVGVYVDGSIASLEVGGASFNETAGLGAMVQEESFTSQFIGKSGTLAYGDDLDAVSGATFTSDAVLNGVNRALALAPAGTVAQATVVGFGGAIDIKVVLNDDGTIASVSFGGDSFAETAGLGERVLEDSFRAQFVGKSAPLAYGDGLDAIAGATMTSNAVLNGINEAIASIG